SPATACSKARLRRSCARTEEVRRLRKLHSWLFSALPDESLEPLNLFNAQMPKFTRLERTQFQEADPHPLQLLHQSPAMLEHDADLILAPFDQPDLIPGILRTPDQFQSGRRRHASLHGNAVPKLLLLL